MDDQRDDLFQVHRLAKPISAKPGTHVLASHVVQVDVDRVAAGDRVLVLPAAVRLILLDAGLQPIT